MVKTDKESTKFESAKGIIGCDEFDGDLGGNIYGYEGVRVFSNGSKRGRGGGCLCFLVGHGRSLWSMKSSTPYNSGSKRGRDGGCIEKFVE